MKKDVTDDIIGTPQPAVQELEQDDATDKVCLMLACDFQDDDG